MPSPCTLVFTMLIATLASPPPCAADSPVVLTGHSSWVNGVAVRGADLIATAGNDGAIGAWRGNGERVSWLHLAAPSSPLGDSELLAHLGVPVYCVAFDRTGRWLAAGCGDGVTRIVGVTPWRIVAELPDASGHVNAVAWLPDGRLLAGTLDGRLVLWDVAQRMALVDRRIFQFPVQGLALSPDGIHAAVASFDSRLRIVALPSLEVSDTRAGHKDVLYAVDWSPDGRHLATGSNDHTVLLWDAAGGAPHSVWQGERPIYAVAFTGDGQHLAVAEQGQPIRILAIPSGEEIATHAGHTADVVALAFTRDGRLVSGARDATARIWPAPNTTP